MATNDVYEEVRKRNLQKDREELQVTEKAEIFDRVLKVLPDENSRQIAKTGSKEQVVDLLNENNISGPYEIFEARDDWTLHSSSQMRKDEPLPSEVNSSPSATLSPTKTAGLAAGGAYLSFDYLKNRKYRKFQKQAEKYAKERAKQWEENPDLKYSKSADSAYRRALNEFHDQFLVTNPEDARRWARQYKDNRLQKAILKKEILNRPNERRNKSAVSAGTTSGPAAGNTAPSSPQTRFEQMAAAGTAINNQQNGDSSWGDKEDVLRQIATNPPENKPIFQEPEVTYSNPQSRQSFRPTPQPQTTKPAGQSQKNRFNPRIPGRSLGRNAGAAGKNMAKSAAKRAGKAAGKKAITFLAANWEVIAIAAAVIIAIAAVIIIIITVIGAINAACKDPTRSPESAILSGIGTVSGICIAENETPPIPGVTITKAAIGDAADGTIDNGASIEYEIILTIDPNVPGAPAADTLTVYDRPEFEFEPSSVEGTGTLSIIDGTLISWKLLENSPASPNTYTFKLKLKPTVTNANIDNTAFVKDLSGRESGTNDYKAWDNTIPPFDENDIFYGQDAEPSHLTCGKYGDIMTQIANNFNNNSVNKNRMRGTGTNFGDPVCSFTNAKLKAVIDVYETRPKSQGYQEFWFDIARCESPGNGPNGWSKSSDAWGHFQMDRTYPNPGKPYDPNDPDPKRGDLTWQNQVREAIKRNKEVINENFTYWETARCLCSTPKHEGKEYCSQVTADAGTCNSVCPNF